MKKNDEDYNQKQDDEKKMKKTTMQEMEEEKMRVARGAAAANKDGKQQQQKSTKLEIAFGNAPIGRASRGTDHSNDATKNNKASLLNKDNNNNNEKKNTNAFVTRMPHHPEEEEEKQEERNEEQGGGLQGNALLTIDNAYCVTPNPEEVKVQVKKSTNDDMLLIEGQTIPEKKQTDDSFCGFDNKTKTQRLVMAMLIFLILAIITVVVVVPTVVVTRQKRRNAAASKSIEAPSTSLPSFSLVPSLSPSVSSEPSFFPTTNAPTSMTFANVISLLGFDADAISLDPNDYVFRSIQWMSEQDEITPLFLQQQEEISDSSNNDENENKADGEISQGLQGQVQQVLREMALQRFAIVSFFYATEGESSWLGGRSDFLNVSAHECQCKSLKQGPSVVSMIP